MRDIIVKAELETTIQQYTAVAWEPRGLDL
jgi:hypothetical protein